MSLVEQRTTASLVQQWLLRANLIALVAVACVAILGQLLLAQLQAPFPENNARMKAAATQAVRGQNIGHLATRLAEASAPGNLYTLRTDLVMELRSFVETHRALAYGDPSMGLTGSMSKQAHVLFFDAQNGLDRWVRDIAKAVESDMIEDGVYVERAVAVKIADDIRDHFNPRIQALINQFSDDARFGVRVSVAARIAIIGVMILAMLTVGQAVYRPTIKRIMARIVGEDPETMLHQQHDGLTGLPNRTYLRNFATELCKLSRDHNLKNAVLHLDLKNYSHVKDTAGLAVADQVLCMAARRIESVCRSGDFIARIGGDEFVIVAAALEDDSTLNDLTDALRTKLDMPFHIDAATYTLGCNVGIAFMDRNDRVVDVVLSHAEMALREARASDEFDIQFYLPNMKSVINDREHVRDELIAAMKDGQLRAHYQPILALDTGALLGVEALVRWHHPTKGILTPVHFMEVAEAYELMTDLTRCILGDSLSAMRHWDDAGIPVPYVAINLGAHLLADQGLIQDVKWTVDSHDLSPERIAFEVDERAFELEDSKEIATQIRLLSEHGFQVLIDDFGTGHLDASQLRRLAIATVKIDRAFITNIDSDPEQQAIASAMIQHAHATKLGVIAEGVETTAERTMLQRLGCDGFQGFLAAEPLSLEVASRWLESYAYRNDTRSRAG